MIGKVILLHAGKKYDTGAHGTFYNFTDYEPPIESESPMGIVGAVVFDRVVHENQKAPDKILGSPWFFGPFGWVIKKVMAFKPIECKGRQGLWTPPDDAMELVRMELDSGDWHSVLTGHGVT
jgi:hypothetical protein